MASSSSSSSIASQRVKYDLFLSFRGSDTRRGFLSHLLMALKLKQIQIFVDDELDKGTEIPLALLRVIEESRISLIVFCRQYAYSRWCLDELVTIIECMKEKGRIAIPIFYDVDPSWVQNQRGTYDYALVMHEKRSSVDKMQNWRKALVEAGRLPGLHSSDFRNDAELIHEIVKLVIQRLNQRSEGDLPALLGNHELNAHAQLESLLRSIAETVLRIGLWGTSGIDKTLPAIDALNGLNHKLQRFCVLKNVSEGVQKYDINQFKKELLLKLLDEKDEGNSIMLNDDWFGPLNSDKSLEHFNVGERNLVCDSSSSATSHDEDDDSNVGGGKKIHHVSPKGSFRRTFIWWQKGKRLGSGSNGAVYEGCANNGLFFAVKEVNLLDKGRHAKQSIVQLQREIYFLGQFEHENIVQYIGTDEDNEKSYIFLELARGGSLSKLYQKYTLGDSQVSEYTRQILRGLNYLHERDVIHRDIKCANILLGENQSVKLADFGLAKETKLNDIKSRQGTQNWMAPEVGNADATHSYGLPADIWSLGCTVLEMLTREPPYSDVEIPVFRIREGELPLIPESISKDARDFIIRCLKVTPSERPTAAELLDHPFVKTE